MLSTGQIVSGANAGAYILYNCPGGGGARVAIAIGDYYIVANVGVDNFIVRVICYK